MLGESRNTMLVKYGYCLPTRESFATLAVQREFGSFDAYLWQFTSGKTKQRGPRGMKDVPAKTAESDAMSKDLKKRGFRFVGSTICYALMQATGMVNDHMRTCFRCAELR